MPPSVLKKYLSFPAERSEGKGTQVVKHSRCLTTWVPFP